MANRVPPQVNVPPDFGSPGASAAGDLSSLGSPSTGRGGQEDRLLASPTGGSNQAWVTQNAHAVTGLTAAMTTHITSHILALLPAQFQAAKGFADEDGQRPSSCCPGEHGLREAKSRRLQGQETSCCS
jgi:hypothetical protein